MFNKGIWARPITKRGLEVSYKHEEKGTILLKYCSSPIKTFVILFIIIVFFFSRYPKRWHTIAKMIKASPHLATNQPCCLQLDIWSMRNTKIFLYSKINTKYYKATNNYIYAVSWIVGVAANFTNQGGTKMSGKTENMFFSLILSCRIVIWDCEQTFLSNESQQKH